MKKKEEYYDPEAPSDFGTDFITEDAHSEMSELALMKMMGLPGIFDTTKGKHVDSNDWGVVKVKSQRVYRQYMNRKGGFNRKLDPDKNVARDTKKKKTLKPGPTGPAKPGKGAKGGNTNTQATKGGKR